MTTSARTHTAGLSRLRNVLHIASAEAVRSLRQGGMRKGLIASAVVGLMVGVLAIVMLNTFSDKSGPDAYSQSRCLEFASAAAAIGMALCVCSHVGRDISSGLFNTASVLVPARGALFLARWLGTGAVVAAFSIVTVLTTATVIVSIGGISRASIGLSCLGLAIIPLCMTIFTSLAFFVSSIAKKPVLSVLVLMGLFLLLPLGAAVIQAALPAGWSDLLGLISQISPTLLLFNAMGVSSLHETGFWPMACGLFGLACWAAFFAALAAIAGRAR